MGKPHGLSGEVYVVPISDDPTRFEPGSTLQSDHGDLVVAGSRRHGDRLLVHFEGIDSRELAERLRGPLYVPASSARALDEDEFWPHELEGCAVLDGSGGEVGTVSRITPGAAHDLLIVATAEGERMIPLVKEIVRSVDVGAGRVVVEPPEGLLD